MKKNDRQVEVKRKIYEKVVSLTAELAETKVAEEIYNAAKAGETRKVQEIIDEFPQKYPELNTKIVNFGEVFNIIREVYDVSVFGYENREEEGIFVYDKDVINPLSFCFFALFVKIEDNNLFENCLSRDVYVKAIKEVTNSDFAQFVLGYSWLEFIEEKREMGKIVVAAVLGFELF